VGVRSEEEEGTGACGSRRGEGERTGSCGALTLDHTVGLMIDYCTITIFHC